MKKVNIVVAIILTSFIAIGQDQTLVVGFVKHDEHAQALKLEAKFDDFIRKIKKKYPNFPYNKAKFENTENINNNFDLIKSGFVGSLRPLTFVRSQIELINPTEAIAIVKKNNAETPYYHVYLIANKNSGITSLKSDKIKKLVLAYKGSTSGDFLPLYMLYEQNIISKPDTQTVRIEKQWQVEYVGKHKKVLEKLHTETNAIGGTGEDPKQSDNVEVLLSDEVPQDVIVVSNDLLAYKKYLFEWFNDEEVRAILFNEGRITDVVPFNSEYKNAYDALKTKYEVINKNNTDLPVKGSNNPYAPYFFIIFIIVAALIFLFIRRKNTTLNFTSESINASEIHNLVAQNKTEEVIVRMKSIAQQKRNSEAEKHLTLISAQLKRYQDNKIMGVLDSDIDMNKINKSLLDVAEALFQVQKNR